MRRPRVLRLVGLWGAVSAAAMAAFAFFGPWETLFSGTHFAVSYSGMDVGNHGWVIVGLGVFAEFAFVAGLGRPRWWNTLPATLAGAAATALTVHDRTSAEHTFTHTDIGLVRAFQGFVHIGWGLNLAMAASISMTIIGLALVANQWNLAARPKRLAKEQTRR